MKVIINISIIISFVIQLSSAIICNQCELSRGNRNCELQTVCNQLQLCETLVSKVEGEYTVTFSCATQSKCGIRLRTLDDINYAMCNHSLSNTECFNCCASDNCNDIEDVLSKLPSTIFSEVALPINPAVATLTLVPNTNLQVAQPGVVITESQATAEDQKLLKEVEKKIVTDLKSIEQEEQKKKIEEAAITNSPLVISLVNQTTSVTAFTQDEENSSETTILKLETINNNATEDFNDDSQEFDAENDSHVSSSIKIFSFGLLVVTISISNVFLA